MKLNFSPFTLYYLSGFKRKLICKCNDFFLFFFFFLLQWYYYNVIVVLFKYARNNTTIQTKKERDFKSFWVAWQETVSSYIYELLRLSHQQDNGHVIIFVSQVNEGPWRKTSEVWLWTLDPTWATRAEGHELSSRAPQWIFWVLQERS